MRKDEIINAWQALLDNYSILEMLLCDDAGLMSAIAPDKRLIEETIRLLREG